jgi:hypothetical protein
MTGFSLISSANVVTIHPIESELFHAEEMSKIKGNFTVELVVIIGITSHPV